MKLDLYNTHNPTQSGLNLNIKCKDIKLENNMGVLSNIALRKANLDMNTQAQTPGA